PDLASMSRNSSRIASKPSNTKALHSRAPAARKEAVQGRLRGRRKDSKKWVYFFGDGKSEGRSDMRNLLGGKGAGLAEMASLGLPVPPGFTITTEVCTYFYEKGKDYPADLQRQVIEALDRIGRFTGKKFGDS